MAFKLNSILNQATLSKIQDSHMVVYIDYKNIFPNPYNDTVYSESNIDLLSYSIEDKGLLQPLVVKKLKDSEIESDITYEIISGHRRFMAIKSIIERGSASKTDFTQVPCIVKNIGDTELTNETLLDGNLFNRQKTPAETAKELAEKKRILLERKKNGENIPGRLMDLIAAEMNINVHQAKKLNSINMNASDNLKDAFEKGEISTEAAYQLSKEDKDVQDEVISTHNDSEADTPLTTKKIEVALNKNHERHADETYVPEVNKSVAEDLPFGKELTDNESESEYGLNKKAPASITSDENTNLNTVSQHKTNEDSEKSKKIKCINNIAHLLKIFHSEQELTLSENEVVEIKDTLNDIYSFVSNM